MYHILHGRVVGSVVVSVTWRDGEPVVCLVLDSRIIPAIADKYGLKINLLCTWKLAISD